VQRPLKFNVHCKVGRLIEARLEWLNEPSEVLQVQEAMHQAFTQAGAGAIICADWRGVEVLSPAVGDALIEMLKRGNKRLERSAVLLTPANAIFNLQVERLLREAANPARRAFRAPELLVAWLGEVLRPDELLRAKQMFAG
jgi:hypothetical protein